MRTTTPLRRLLQTATLLLCSFNLAISSETTEPLLRIESGSYVGSTDANGRLLALSNNTGIQIMDIKSNKLIRKLFYYQTNNDNTSGL